MVLAIIGGLFIVLGGLVERAVGSLLSSFGFGLGGAILRLVGTFAVVLGGLIIVLGVLAFVRPRQHGLFGVLIIALSLLSLVSYLGGFVIGFILALIAGILAVTWKPRPG